MQHGADGVAHDLLVVVMHEGLPGIQVRPQIALAPAGDALQPFGIIGGVGFQIPLEDAVFRAAHRQAVARLAASQSGLGGLAVGDVAQIGGQKAHAAAFDLGNGELHRKAAAIGAQGFGFDAAAQQARRLAGHVALHAFMMGGAQMLRHQQLAHILAQRGIPGDAEHAFGGGVEFQHLAAQIGNDHGIQGCRQ